MANVKNRIPLLIFGAVGSALLSIGLLVSGSGLILYAMGKQKLEAVIADAGVTTATTPATETSASETSASETSASETSAPDSSTPEAPTEAEVRETIEQKFHEIYFQDYGGAQAAEAKIEVGAVELGHSTLLQVEYGKDAQPVIPVHAVVHVRVTYSNNSTVRELTRGEGSDDAFLFYRDGFGKWTFRTGSA